MQERCGALARADTGDTDLLAPACQHVRKVLDASSLVVVVCNGRGAAGVGPVDHNTVMETSEYAHCTLRLNAHALPSHVWCLQDIEEFLEQRVYLELGVQVMEKWQDSKEALQRFGYFDPMLI